MTNWQNIHELVTSWMKEAGDIIVTRLQSAILVQAKQHENDLVTNVDREIEQFFTEKIRHTFTEHFIVGEEGFGDKITSLDGIVWFIDPIDGTMNFVHQQRNFSISLAIYENGIGQLGYVYDVIHKELYYAKKGEGAFLNHQKLEKLADVSMSEAIISINPKWIVENFELLSPIVKQVRGARSYASAALEMVYVATGRLDCYLSLGLAPWDFAAGAIIVAECGGEVTKANGSPLNLLEKSTLFVAKKSLHQELKKYLQGVDG